MTTLLRPATLDDAAAFTDVRRSVTPYQVVTEAGVRHRWTTSSDAAKLLVLVAEVDGEVAGVGRAEINTWTSQVGAAVLNVMVRPEYRGRGIGSRLYEALAEHLRENGAKRLQGWATDEPGSARWCVQRGFERTHELRFSRLDLTDVAALPPVPAFPDRVTVATCAEVGPEGVYAVDAVAIMDEPGDVTEDAVPYQEWLTDVWQGPGNDLEASTVVLVDGVPAALTLVEAEHATGRMSSGGTGTLREHRGQGLAKIAKSIALRRAAATGITTAYTSNDEVNRPMLAINEWLGYRACATQWSYVKVLTDPSAPLSAPDPAQ